MAGWTLTNLVCSQGTTDIPTRTASVTLAAGDAVTCTYTNTKDATLTIVKNAVPDDAQDFAFTTTGTGPAGFTGGFSEDDDADGTLPSTRTFTFNGNQLGAKTVVEGAITGWDLTSLVCSQGTTDIPTRTASVTLAAGDAVTCTFTNTKRASLTIVKDTKNPETDAEDFAFSTTGAGLSAFDLDDDADATLANSTTFANIVSNSARTVTEGAETEWVLTNITCTGATTWSGNTTTRVLSVTPAPGEVITCTFRNERKARLLVTKTIVGGGTQLFDFTRNPGGVSFTLTDAGSNNSGFSLAPNTYRVCENNLAVSWAATATLDAVAATLINPDLPQDLGNRCVDVTLAYGDSKTVAWTNRPPPGGNARTIGYWKNWSSCSASAGNQYSKALARGIWNKTLDGNLPQQIGDLFLAGAPGPNLPSPDCAKAVSILNKSDIVTGKKMASDPAYGLAAQLLAAKLSVSAGAGLQCNVTQLISDAQTLLDLINFTGTGAYAASMTAAQKTLANTLAGQLDKYNNNTCP